MKILNIIQCTNLGGMERSNLARLRALKDCGHACHVVSLNEFGDLLPLLRASSIPCNAFRYGWDKVGTLIGLMRQLRKEEHDVVICTGHNLLTTLALPGNRKSKQVMCIHFHHSGVKPPWFWRAYYGFAMKKFCHIFFNSSFIRDEALALVPALKSASSILPNIYEVPDLCSVEAGEQAKVELGFSKDTPVISNAGWLIPRKRFDVFIQVAAAIKVRLPEAVFLIAGDGEERASLEQLAQKLGLEGTIHWLGWQEDLELFYSASDLVLFNTDWDAVARTPIEAGLRGVNLMCSEINGGLRDMFDNPEWILDSHNVDALADAVVELLGQPETRAEQIRFIRETIIRKCAPEAHVRTILDQVCH